MITAMNSIKEMIDVNTIIGEPIKALDNTVIIPISKVGFGFAAGGSEFNGETVNSYSRKEKEENIKYRLPFGGGSGAGANITPVAFLIVQNDTVKLLEATHSSILDKLVEYVPDVIEKINKIFNKKIDNKINEEIYDDFDYEDDEDYTDINSYKQNNMNNQEINQEQNNMNSQEINQKQNNINVQGTNQKQNSDTNEENNTNGKNYKNPENDNQKSQITIEEEIIPQVKEQIIIEDEEE